MEELTAALKAIDAPGEFATRRTCTSDDLHLAVTGLGPVSLPVSASAARRLYEAARSAPFGWRDQTLTDDRVRRTRQIAKSNVKIDARAWRRTLAPQLAAIQRDLGLDPRGTLKAELDKLLVYGPGDFFVAHQDSERSDDMVGSLVVVLPSTYRGGAVVVVHGAERKTFRKQRRPGDLLWIAFYADCQHEVQPVTAGYRLALQYNLRYEGPPLARHGLASAPEQLTQALGRHFSSPPPKPRYAAAAPPPPDRLVYLLDHEYTQKSLGWQRLKNGDRARVEAVLRAADALDCEAHLTLADVQETWSCESDDDPWRRRYRPWGYGDDVSDDDDLDSSSAEADGLVLVELCERSVVLRHWVRRDGKVAPTLPPSQVDPLELCFTRASDDMDPLRSEHEGWMGNYGNTVDRWYCRAALVVWPRARAFALRAKHAPARAVSELLALVKRGATSEALEKARSVLPGWERAAAHEEHASFVEKTVDLAKRLDDAALAAGLLRPLSRRRFTPSSARLLASVARRHGYDWAQRVFAAWEVADRRSAGEWSAVLPTLCEGLCEGASPAGARMARWLVTQELQVLRSDLGPNGLPSRAIGTAGRPLPERAADLVAAAAVAGLGDVAGEVLDTLFDSALALPLIDLAEVLEACAARGVTVAQVPALPSVFDRLIASLRARAEGPARRADDWSIEPPRGCRCELCATLVAFLADAGAIERGWKLAKAHRAHVHQVIDRNALPVTHSTQRTGSPYTLVLRKLPALFTADAALREKERARLRSLVASRARLIAH